MNSDHNPDQENGSTDSLDNLLDSVRNHLGATPESAADLDEEIPLLTEVVVPATSTPPPPRDMITRSALIEPELPATEENPAGSEGNSHWGSQGADHEKAAADWLDETVLSTTIDIAGISVSDTTQDPDSEQDIDLDLEMAAETAKLEAVDDEAADPTMNLTSGSQVDPYRTAQREDHEKAPADWLDDTVLSTSIDIAGISASATKQDPDSKQGLDIDLETAAETTRLEEVDGDDNRDSPAVNISAPEGADQQAITPEPDDNAIAQVVDEDFGTGDSQLFSPQTPSLTDSSTENYEPVETSMESTPHAMAGLETQSKEHPEGSQETTAHQTDTVAADDLSLCLEQLEQLIDHRCSRLANELKDEVRQLFTDFPTD